MRNITQKYMSTDFPMALEYLEYGKQVFEKLPDSFEFENEKVLVSCHHLCAIMKARFKELIEYHGFCSADGFIKVRNHTKLLLGGYDNQDMTVDHSWLSTPDQQFILDMYPVGYSCGPVLIDGFVRQPLKYGKHFYFLFLREEKFKKQVARLLEMLEESKDVEL